MNIIFIELYGMYLCGSAIHYLKEWNEAYKTKTKFDLRYNAVTACMSVIIGFVMVYCREDFKQLYSLTLLTSAAFGYAGQSAILGLLGSKIKVPKDEGGGQPTDTIVNG